jgi:hypothetical protein
MEQDIISKAIGGFNSCALVAAFYNMNEVFDNIVVCLYILFNLNLIAKKIALCNFSTLSQLVDTDKPDVNIYQITNYAMNIKVSCNTR